MRASSDRRTVERSNWSTRDVSMLQSYEIFSAKLRVSCFGGLQESDRCRVTDIAVTSRVKKILRRRRNGMHYATTGIESRLRVASERERRQRCSQVVEPQGRQPLITHSGYDLR